MRVAKLADMTGGWFVGAFAPAALGCDACEVAIKRFRAGDAEPLHHHRIATEVTAIVAGTVRMAGRMFAEGDIVIIEPGEASAFEALTDAVLVVVKRPSVAGDKFTGSA